MEKKAIIIGASTGIGRELAKVLSSEGYIVGLAARREELLRELQQELPNPSVVQAMDVADTEQARERLNALLAEMGDVELIVLNAGIGIRNPDWEQQYRLLMINAVGFAALAELAMSYFTQRGGGRLAGISSVMALKGVGRFEAYSASKAFISTYMQGLRQKSRKLKLNITVTDVKPGFVATPMTEHNENMFWVAPADKAARQIYRAIQKRRSHVYITRRWRLVGWIMKAIPDWLFTRLPV